MIVFVIVVIGLVVAVFAWVVLTFGAGHWIGDALQFRTILADALALWQRGDLQVDVSACHLGLHVGMTHGGEILFDTLGELKAQFLVGHLAAAELELDAHFVAFCQEVFSVGDLDGVIVGINPDAELELLDLAVLGVLMGLFLVLLLDVLVLAVIDNFAHWRVCTGGDLNEVHAALFGHAEGDVGGHDAELGIVLALDDADLRRTDTLIDAGLILITTLKASTIVSTAVTAGAATKTTAATDVVLLWPGCGCACSSSTSCGWWGTVCGCAANRWRGGTIGSCALGTTWWASGEVTATQVVEWIAYG